MPPKRDDAPTAERARAALRAAASPEDALHAQRYFRTGPGEYGEGDRFLGVRVPPLRRLARAFRALPPDETAALLRRHYHVLPRTALRYATERLPPEERRAWLAGPG